MYLAVYIFIKSPKALGNRILVGVILCFALWSFASIFVHNPYTTQSTARLFDNISSFGWISFSSFFLWFILAFTGRKEVLKNKWFYILIFAIPLVLIYKQWTNGLIINYKKTYYGWKAIFSTSIWPHLFYLYYLSFSLVMFFIGAGFIRKTRDIIKRKQMQVVLFGLFIVLIIGTVTDIFLPLLNIHSVPNMADVTTLFLAIAIAYAMIRYKFLTITPATAAGNIISTMYDSLVLLDMKGNIVSTNKAVENLLEYKENEVKGKPVDILFPEEDKKKGVVDKIISAGNLENADFVLKTKSGKAVPVLFSSSLLQDDTGTAGGIVCVARDISERKKLDEEVLKTKKLEAIGMLAAGIAHDFNNLLSGVMGNIALAQNLIEPGGKSQELLEKAEEASLRAAALAGKFITFSRQNWLQRREVIFSQVLKTLPVGELLGPGISYEVDIPGNLSSLYGDEDQIGQLLHNLFQNAAEAMPGGGKLLLRAENIVVEPQSKLPVKSGEYVKVVLEDSGCGIAEENIDRVFDPYFTTKEKDAQKGMGLGLTICYSIIKKHRGRILLDSEVGKGTVVTLFFPVETREEPG